MIEDNEVLATKKVKPSRRKKKIRWTDKLFEEYIMKPLAEGVTISQIAENLKITRQSVTLRLKAYGINNKTEALQEILRRAKEGSTV